MRTTTSTPTLAVVIGAGPSGLAAALRAADEGIDQVIVLEKRVHESEAPDAELVAATDPRDSTDVFRDAFERNNTLQLSYWSLRQLAAWGIQRDDPHLCMHRVAAVHISDHYRPPPPHKQHGEVLDQPATRSFACLHEPTVLEEHAADVADIRDVTPRRIKEDNLPFEVSGVPIQCLQRALYHAARRLYPDTIHIHYGVTDLQLLERDGRVGRSVRATLADKTLTWDPDVIVAAEGGRRELLKRDLGLASVLISKPQLFMYGFLTSEASAALGPHIYFNRVWDPEVSRPDNNRFAKHSIIGRPGAPGQAVCFVQCDGRSDRTCETLLTDMQRHMQQAFPSLRDVNLEFDPSIPPQRCVVQETHASCYVTQNVLVVGDAARTGHFCSAVGVPHSLVSDGNAIGPVCEAVVQLSRGKGTQADVDAAKTACEARMREVAQMYHENDLFWFYEQVNPNYVRESS